MGVGFGGCGRVLVAWACGGGRRQVEAGRYVIAISISCPGCILLQSIWGKKGLSSLYQPCSQVGLWVENVFTHSEYVK